MVWLSEITDPFMASFNVWIISQERVSDFRQTKLNPYFGLLGLPVCQSNKHLIYLTSKWMENIKRNIPFLGKLAFFLKTHIYESSFCGKIFKDSMESMYEVLHQAVHKRGKSSKRSLLRGLFSTIDMVIKICRNVGQKFNIKEDEKKACQVYCMSICKNC